MGSQHSIRFRRSHSVLKLEMYGEDFKSAGIDNRNHYRQDAGFSNAFYGRLNARRKLCHSSDSWKIFSDMLIAQISVGALQDDVDARCGGLPMIS